MSRSFILPMLLLSLTGLSSAGWEVVGIGVPSGGITPSLALDGGGAPHIAYSDGMHVTHGWNDGSGWSTEHVFTSLDGGPSGIDIAIDEQDHCRISFQRSGMLYYAVQTAPGAWTTGLVTPITYAEWTSIALDGDSAPLIASSYSESLALVHWTTSGWQPDAALAGIPFDGQTDCVSLALDSACNPHIAFCVGGSAYAVMLASRSGDAWSLDTVDVVSGYVPKGTSLVLDTQDHPHLSYHTQTALRYAAWDGASWQIETIDAVDTGVYEYGTSLALDAYGHPHIAHVSADGESLLYSLDDGSGWTTETACSIPSQNGGDPSLVLDDLGRPRIAFHQGWYVGLGYAWNDDPTGISSVESPLRVPELRVGPNPFGEALSIRCTSPDPISAEVRIYDACGRMATSLDASVDGSGSRTIIWRPGPSVASGVYFVVLSSGDTRECERCLLLR
jgi:hypothetical protein